MGGHKPADATPSVDGATKIAWSRDGQTLFAAGAIEDAQDRRLLFAWDRGGMGDERRMTYCAPSTVAGVDALPDGRTLVASMTPCLGLMNADGHPVWTVGSRIFDFRTRATLLRRLSTVALLISSIKTRPATPTRQIPIYALIYGHSNCRARYQTTI